MIQDFLTDDEPIAEFNSDAFVQQGRDTLRQNIVERDGKERDK
jgi:hypothetical protein